VGIHPDTNRVIVGDADDLICGEFEIDRTNWIARVAGTFQATVKIRYSHPGAAATVTILPEGRAHIRLHDPQRAVTPGQAAVVYEGDLVLGGGWICRTQPVHRITVSRRDSELTVA